MEDELLLLKIAKFKIMEDLQSLKE